MTVLPQAPPRPVDLDGRMQPGLYAGRMLGQPVELLPRRPGRVRRWRYAAAAGDGVGVGAAVADLGYVGAAFAWAYLEGALLTWEARSLLGRAVEVGDEPSQPAAWRRRDEVVSLGDGGEIVLDVPVEGGRLVAQFGVGPTWPVTLITRTHGGGWNVTEKAAGYAVRGNVAGAGSNVAVAGWGWRDWTVGRQDRRTQWLWAAGAGSVGAREVGFNVSTGMNGEGDGENVVWWDRRPVPLVVDRFDRGSRKWVLSGPSWALTFEPLATRAADERVGPFVSRYLQPFGRFRGTLPGPDSGLVEVELDGVTESHVARW